VVAVSSFGRSQLFRHVDRPQWEKIHVVHCGLEPTFFEGKPSYSESLNLICVGRFTEQKGQLLLIEAARHLVQAGVDFTLTLAGDGELRGEIETLIKRYELGLKIKITGWVSSNEVRERILNARALVLPSFAEGLPVVIMEAMALRRPVISTFVAGIPELVHDEIHGWLVPAGDVDALVRAMRQCLESQASRLQAMGDAARVRAFQLHNVETEGTKLVHLFKLAPNSH
jgi:colanic acid/amylovoran biosynthesis glycosyltransferase